MTEQEFAQIIKNNGGTAYRVGGNIRNELLDIPVNDNDYCVAGITHEIFLQVFSNAVLIGQNFPVFLLDIDDEKCEVAFARKERKTSSGHKGFEVDFSSDVTIEDDLARRDFTMNAIAYDILQQKLIDPFNGQQDIADKIIRATSEAFKEDALRVYRAARFASQLGFEVELNTLTMFADDSLQEDMKLLPVERVFEELKKALKASNPDKFFQVLKKGASLHIHFKEVHDLIGVEQPPKHHPEGDAYNHTMQVLAEMSKLTGKVERRFTALCHDLGKARTPKEFWPKHHGHEGAGVKPLYEMCERLKLPVKWKSAAYYGVVNHMKFHRAHEMRYMKRIDLIEGAGKSTLGTEGLAQLGLADIRGRNELHEIHENYKLFMHWAKLISTVKGNSELKGKTAWEDKRKRQVSLIKYDTTSRV